LQNEDEDLLVEVGSAKWLGRASAAKASAATVGVFVAMAASPAGLIAAGTAAVGMDVWRRQQYRLSNQTISFLRETAPRYVGSDDDKEENRRDDFPPSS
jgi:hypothetical protein